MDGSHPPHKNSYKTTANMSMERPPILGDNVFELYNYVDEGSYTAAEEALMRQVADKLGLILTEKNHTSTSGDTRVFRFKGRVSSGFLLGALCFAGVTIASPGMMQIYDDCRDVCVSFIG